MKEARPTDRPQCEKILKSGRQCKYHARPDSMPYCHLHDPKVEEYFRNVMRSRQ